MSSATPIVMPKVGQAMTEGTLNEWLVQDGQVVEAGAPLYVLEADKVEVEIDSPATGRIELIGEEGVVYEVGTELARITT